MDRKVLEFVQVSVFVALALMLNGCNVSTTGSSGVNRDLQRQINEDIRKNDVVLEQFKKSLSRGGQPGTIKVSGVVVNERRGLDPRITIHIKGGIGLDGVETQSPIPNPDELPFQVTTADQNRTQPTRTQDVLAVGCDAGAVQKFAQSRKLTVRGLPEPISDSVLKLKAQVVTICGKPQGIEFPILTVEADELILEAVDFERVSHFGAIILTANKLILNGTNSITTRGPKSTMPAVSSAPSIELNVMQAIESRGRGSSLTLSSYGSSYETEAAPR